MFRMTIFGESHGPCVGVTLEGVPPGLELDMDFIKSEMDRRRPGKDALSTMREEQDKPEIIGGFFLGRATGAPLCAVIKNSDTRPGDYDAVKSLARPGHADYTGFVRYGGFNDYRGGGHFSGRLTAPLVFAGAVAKLILKKRGINVGGHIRSIAGVCDTPFDCVNITPETLENIRMAEFPAIDPERGAMMRGEIMKAASEGDSVGGVIECAITGMPAGAGNPGIGCVESHIARHVFAIPAVKGIEFGTGFRLADMRGSQANDPFYMKNGAVCTKTNHNGGINGGITNGMPVVFSVCIKPTPSISQEQDTVDFLKNENKKINIAGRHDPCVVHRAVPVVEAAAAVAVCELLSEVDI